MILSNKTLEELIAQKIITFQPEALIKEASIKIHLSSLFAKIGAEFNQQDSYILKPKEFILAQSKETISLPLEYAGLYDGYTHLSRKGIITHMGSMFIDPGTDSYITLEIFNASDKDVELEAGMRVGHVVILEVR